VPNALAPRKRPRTTLSPSLGFWDGTPWLAFGTPGGDQQDQWSLLLLLRMAHHGMTLQQAIDAPAFHTATASSAPAWWAKGDLNPHPLDAYVAAVLAHS
jgi:gamma-glutamyltranspeptidase/glutathione hydrolase